MLKLWILLFLSLMVAFSARANVDSILNPKNQKHSAVIRIENQVNLGLCTAFVINDKVAITAAHCVLKSDPLVGNSIEVVKDDYKVYNTKGEDTFVVVKAHYAVPHVDMAVLKGNFTEFNKLPVDAGNFVMKPQDKVYMCGFAGGFSPPVCTEGEFLGTAAWMGVTNAYIAKGMSGGPVLNKDFKAVGFNSARTVEGTSLFGILFGNVKVAK